MKKIVVVMAALLLGGAAFGGEVSVEEKFQAFCKEWMRKLAARERDNRNAIRWQPGPGGVVGEFIGYSADHSCFVKPVTSGEVPIGKIVYRELVYRQAGGSMTEAQQKPPQPIDATEVTEIFRYSKGQWVY